jgi:peptidoglycan/LPS O-acetylase OafA/YrhL
MAVINDKNTRVFGLDLLRALAITLVVLAHFFASTPLKFGGLLGVELFFVLSGFLIGGILISSFVKNGSTFKVLKEFWLRRWFRTIPNYIVFLFIFTPRSVLLGEISFEKWMLYPFFLQNFAWPMGNFFLVSWSLAVEEWFYLTFPSLLWITTRKRGISSNRICIITACFLVVPPALRAVATDGMDFDTMRGITLFHLDSMMYGVFMSVIRFYKHEIWKRMATLTTLVFGIGFVILGTIFYYNESLFIQIFSLPVISAGTALALPCIEKTPNPQWFLTPVVNYVSKVSYSAYLLHMPIFLYTESLVNLGSLPVYVKLCERVVLIAAVFLLSYIPYKFIEIPFLSVRDRLSPKNH